MNEHPEAVSAPMRCTATNTLNERCIYGSRHRVAHHRFPSEVDATVVSEWPVSAPTLRERIARAIYGEFPEPRYATTDGEVAMTGCLPWEDAGEHVRALCLGQADAVLAVIGEDVT